MNQIGLPYGEPLRPRWFWATSLRPPFSAERPLEIGHGSSATIAGRSGYGAAPLPGRFWRRSADQTIADPL